MSQWDVLCFMSLLLLCTPVAYSQGLLGALNGLGNGLNNQLYPGVNPNANLLNLASLNLGGNNNPNRFGFQNNQRPNLGGYNNMNPNQNKDQILADGQKLLEKLQNLNKQKNENKLNGNNNNNNANGAGSQNIGNNPNGGLNNGINNNFNNPDTSNNLNQGVSDNEKPLKLKALTKVKFFFQAQPVVPENEVQPRNETVYFLDFK